MKNMESYSSVALPVRGLLDPEPGKGYTHRNKGKKTGIFRLQYRSTDSIFNLPRRDGVQSTPIIGPGADAEQQYTLNCETNYIC
jgi:hypothetical protein